MKKNAFILCVAHLCLLAVAGGALAAPEYTLSLNLMIPPVHNRWHKAIKPWADEIEKRSEGRIRIEPYFAEALSKGADAFESVKAGVADLAEFCFDNCPGEFPFHERAFTLISPDRSLDNPGPWLLEMERAHPAVMRELEGVKLLFTHTLNVGMMVGSKEPITSLAGLKGKKINVDGDAQVSDKVKRLGCSVVNMPPSDVFMSLQQGVVDGTTCDFDILISRRYGESIRHVTLINTGSGTFAMIMNQDVYNSLPDDLRKIFDDVSREYGTRGFNTFWADGEYSSLEAWQKQYGGEIHMLSEEEYRRIDELVQPSMREWIEVINAAGLPGEELAASFREMEKRYTAPWSQSRIASYVR